MTAAAFCPATMCPLFAPTGSEETGLRDARCSTECGWNREGSCWAARTATGEIVAETARTTRHWRRLDDPHRRRTFDCPRAAECVWQQQTGGLCAPRRALAHGLDPRGCR